MELTDRQKLILEKLIEEYVKTAAPVASAGLAKKYDFDVKPAMLRIEMEKLEKLGYLSQPFVSAGRVPTDKAYRFFVDNLLKNKKEGSGGSRQKPAKKIPAMIARKNDYIETAQELAKTISELTSSLVLSYLPEEHLFFKEGWSQIIREPEFEDSHVFEAFAEMVENWEKNILPEMDFSGEIKIFIGEENPVREAEGFSAIAGRLLLPNKEKGIMAIFGPKRMEYDQNISIFASLNKFFLEKYNH